MAFDPSTIGQIGEQPDFGSAVSKGFQIKDLMNANTLDQYKLRQAKQQEEDDKTVRQVTSGADLSSPAGVSKAASELTKKGLPDASMKLVKGFQDIQSGALDNQIRTLQATQSAMDFSASMFDPLYQRATQMRTEQVPDGRGGQRPRYTDAEINAYITSQVPTFIKQIKEAPDTVLAPQFKQAALARAASTPNITYDQLQSIENDSKSHREKIKAQLDALNVKSEIDTRQGGLEERTRHDKELEKNATRKTTDSEKGGDFSDTERSLLAELALRNVSLPAGLRSQKQIKATLDGLIEKEKDRTPGEIADDIKSGKLKLTAESKGAQVAGTQIGKVALATNEIDTFGDQTLEASRAVPRGKVVPWNSFKQMLETKTSDKDLLRFRAKMTALNNAYEQLAARSGIDKDKRDHIHALFDTANSPEAVETLVQALKEEAQGAKSAADRTIAETSGTAIPGAGGTSKSGTVVHWDDLK